VERSGRFDHVLMQQAGNPMSIIESGKSRVEALTGLYRPSRAEIDVLRRERKAVIACFKDDGLVPNNPDLPFVFYRSPLRLDQRFDPAAIFEATFESNGWGDCWRNGIYTFIHFHPRIHEVLGIARGKGRVQFGGSAGRVFAVKAGDVAILPAGTGHQLLSGSKDLLVVGAYPPGTYDVFRARKDDHDRALTMIGDAPMPRRDPVYGNEGPLVQAWRRRRRAPH
jgi:uncharacterized protein YjlB